MRVLLPWLSLLQISPALAECRVELTRQAEAAASREFPSVFQAWNPAQNLNPGPLDRTMPLAAAEDPATTQARHDLMFTGWGALGLRSSNPYPGLAADFAAASIDKARAARRSLHAKNPALIVIAEIRYADAPDGYLPADSPWWKRDLDGHRMRRAGPHGLLLLDYANAAFQDHVAAQCRAVAGTGAADGCMFDWWNNDDADHLALIRKVRAAVGDRTLLIVNVNGTIPRASAPFINGIFMEGFGSSAFSDWHVAAANLLWAQTHLCAPALTLLEGWYREGRNDYALMRAVTTLSLTHSNGYVLFGDPNPLPTPDHLHDWYPFWNHSLGHAVGPLAQPAAGRSFLREFEHGTAVFNPPDGARIRLHFPDPRSSAATGEVSQDHDLDAGDGDLYMRVPARR